MVLHASELLRHDGLDPVAIQILSLCAVLDDLGAGEWNLYYAVMASVAALYVIRQCFDKSYGIDWYAFTHALTTGLGSMAVVYLDLFAAEATSGTPEPLRSCQCKGALTSLHRLLPAVTMGYSLLDMFDGYQISMDFFLHGTATFCVMGYFIYYDVPHLISPMLLMEVSTMFLTVVRAEFFTPLMTSINQALFSFFFFLCRGAIVPFIWTKLMLTMYHERSDPVFRNCFPMHVPMVSFFFGLFFHTLNAFWMIKIVRKIRRKMSGMEKIQDNNDLGENGAKHMDKKRV